MKKCVFAGTFDPPTTGHKNVIDTAEFIVSKAASTPPS